VQPYPKIRQKLEGNETHDIKLDGKNRMELNGNDRGAYKHRPSEQNQRHYNEHRFATDMNRIMLYSRLKFKPQSKLRKYLSRKTGIRKSCYFLAEIAHELKIIIRSEGLYDPRNPSIIMCDQPLEKALGMKDLHIIEVRDQILKQTTMMKRQEWRDNFNTFISTSKGRTASARPPAHSGNK
jgi:hypothetical protein